MIDVSLACTVLYFWSRKYGLRSSKMRRRKRVLLVIFTIFCGAVFYGYSRGKGDASNEVKSHDHKVDKFDLFDDMPYGNLRPRHSNNGRRVVVNQVLQAIEKPDVVKIADKNGGGGNQNIFGNDVLMSNDVESFKSDNVFRGNRKKILEPISLKPQVQNEKADVIQVHDQQNGLHNGAQVRKSLREV